mgnify:FL=1|jgi:N/a
MTLIYDDWGRSALTDAILQKQTQKALMLLRECDDVNHKDNGGHSDLYFAAQSCEVEVVCELLRKGADPNIETFSRVTPLNAALFASQHYSYEQAYKIVELLLAAGANPDHKNHRGVSIRQISKSLAPGSINDYIQAWPISNKQDKGQKQEP